MLRTRHRINRDGLQCFGLYRLDYRANLAFLLAI